MVKMPKFRAWDEYEEKMWNVETLYIEDEWVKVNAGSIYDETKDLIRSYKLMQSTGLKDINDVEIYEGDIVKNKYKELGVIKNLGDAFCFYHNQSNYYFESWGSGKPFEVVGNQYEHPYILEAE